MQKLTKFEHFTHRLIFFQCCHSPESNLDAAQWKTSKTLLNQDECRSIVNRYDTHLQNLLAEQHNPENQVCSYNSVVQERLVSSDTVNMALKCLVKCDFTDIDDANQNANISVVVRRWEYILGKIGRTTLTDHLSLRLLTANSKAGNIGRVISLLQLRSRRGYRPRLREFDYAITAIQIASKLSMSSSQSSMNDEIPKSQRNIFLSDSQQPSIDNPTRWLDAILINMKERNFDLTLDLVNRMLYCYTSTSGPSGKSVHHFYRLVRKPIVDDDIHDKSNTGRPKGWFYIPGNQPNNIKIREKRDDDEDRNDTNITSEQGSKRLDTKQGRYLNCPIKVQLKYHSHPPPFYKVPSQVKGQLLFRTSNVTNKIEEKRVEGDESKKATANHEVGQGKNKFKEDTENNKEVGQYRIEREMDPNFCVTLTAAFAFADSIERGVCGHKGIQLYTESYNELIRACVNRGSLWRAMHIIDQNTASINNNNLKPDILSYNLLLAGLARVGDVATIQEYVYKLLNAGLKPDSNTVKAVTNGLLNLGDVSSAVTITQDFFNQHNILPPYTQHLKIIETCLALDLVYEAKRYCYFIQQLWHYQPNDKYHDMKFINLMKRTKRNPYIQKDALQKLFTYFGYELHESDFL